MTHLNTLAYQAKFSKWRQVSWTIEAMDDFLHEWLDRRDTL